MPGGAAALNGAGHGWPLSETLSEDFEESEKLAQLMRSRFPTLAGMDAIGIETLKQDVQQGLITADRLVELIASQQRTLQVVLQQLQASQQRCAELEQKLGGPPTTKLDQP